MQKYVIFLFFIFNQYVAFSQVDSSGKHRTIKIAKLKPDSVYIKADLKFSQFQDGSIIFNESSNVQNRSDPYPVITGYTAPFDYSRLFDSEINVMVNNLGDKISDTVTIQVKVLENGKAYFKDLTPLMMLNGVPAYYDKKMNAYKLDAVHLKCMNLLKHIKKWEPAYVEIDKRAKFKGTTVIKSKKKNLSAIGIITIVFSKVPFEELKMISE
ncbi:MAG: hypothetical protein V4608_09105 [Bacteroidota bacterium]